MRYVLDLWKVDMAKVIKHFMLNLVPYNLAVGSTREASQTRAHVQRRRADTRGLC